MILEHTKAAIDDILFLNQKMPGDCIGIINECCRNMQTAGSYT